MIFEKNNSKMDEKHVENHFRKHRDKLFKKFGRKALDNFQLDKICKDYLKSKYIGTFAQDKIPLNKEGYMIVNTDKSGKPGTHWVAIYSTNKTFYVYDSYGRSTKSLLKILTKKLKNKKIKIVDSDRDQEQRGNSEVCGVLCCAWLFTCRDLSVRNAIKI